MTLGINEFYDINKLPKSSGIYYLALSMPYLGSLQHPKELYEMDLETIEKQEASNTGVHVVYTDNLYFYSPDNAMELKTKFQRMIEIHKRTWVKLIEKNIFLIPKAFNFVTWNQLMLDCPNFTTYLENFRSIYDKDELLQKYVRLDIKKTGRRVNKYTIGYILEEILL